MLKNETIHYSGKIAPNTLLKNETISLLADTIQ
jgi:hypothetical protein